MPRRRNSSERKCSVDLDVHDDSDGSYRAIPQTDDPETDDLVATRSSRESLHHEESILEQCINSNTSQAIIVSMTLANGIVIGLETDYEKLTRWDVVENGFVVVFFIELVLKLLAFGPRDYFSWSNPEFAWNMFDVCIISVGAFDMLMRVLPLGGSSGHHTSFATVMRSFRLLRVLRLLRIVRYLKKLYLLVFGLLEAAKAVIWITVLMSFVLYVCAVLLVHTVGRLPEDAPANEFLAQRYGSVQTAMLTLFQFMSSPTLMEYEENGLMHHYPLLIGFLVVWIIFGSFGIVAMLTGVISESIFDKNQMWLNEQRTEKEELHKEIKRWCREKFNEVPHNEQMEATKEDVKTLLPDLPALCDELAINYTHHEIRQCIRYMDHDHSGGISFPEFTHTILTMLEGESSVSNQELKHYVHTTLLYVEKISNFVQKMHGDSFEIKHTARKSSKGHSESLQRLEEICNSVSKVANAQQDNVRSVTELSIAMANTLQSMSDFATDMKRRDEACMPAADLDWKQHLTDVLKRSLTESFEDLARLARIDAASICNAGRGDTGGPKV